LKAKILIVEDQFIEAKSLNVILINAGYSTCTIARSVTAALSIIEKEKPDLVLVDIFLQGEETPRASLLRSHFISIYQDEIKKFLNKTK